MISIDDGKVIEEGLGSQFAFGDLPRTARVLLSEPAVIRASRRGHFCEFLRKVVEIAQDQVHVTQIVQVRHKPPFGRELFQILYQLATTMNAPPIPF